MALSKKVKTTAKKATPKKVCTQHQDKDGKVCGRPECVMCGA